MLDLPRLSSATPATPAMWQNRNEAATADHNKEAAVSDVEIGQRIDQCLHYAFNCQDNLWADNLWASKILNEKDVREKRRQFRTNNSLYAGR